MIFLYHCYGGTHSSVIAASIHIGRLPQEGLPLYKEIIGLPFYDRIPKEKMGIPHYIGTDINGHDVYAIGMGRYKKIIIKTVFCLLDIYRIPPENLKFVDAGVKLNWLTRIGGFLSRRLGLVALGRPLTVYGIRKIYSRFVSLALNARNQGKHPGRRSRS